MLDVHGRLLPKIHTLHPHKRINLETEEVLAVYSGNVTIFLTRVIIVIAFPFILNFLTEMMHQFC